eukprot:COSAG06_NODE_2241_length_7269_cov_9.419944_7_plen_82_part_00
MRKRTLRCVRVYVQVVAAMDALNFSRNPSEQYGLQSCEREAVRDPNSDHFDESLLVQIQRSLLESKQIQNRPKFPMKMDPF